MHVLLENTTRRFSSWPWFRARRRLTFLSVSCTEIKEKVSLVHDTMTLGEGRGGSRVPAPAREGLKPPSRRNVPLKPVCVCVCVCVCNPRKEKLLVGLPDMCCTFRLERCSRTPSPEG